MRFFYRLERFEGGEYVVVEVEEGKFKGTGAVLPDRSRGENYKTIMGAIEEYRYIVERSRPEHFAVISQRLEKHFPGHPETRFAISAAFFELFAKLNGMSTEDLILVEKEGMGFQREDIDCEVRIVPEREGGVFEAIVRSSTVECICLKDYPNGEMVGVLEAIAMYFKKIERCKRKEG